MAYFVEPGHISMVMLTPEQYIRMYHAQGPNLWPVYFGARMAAQTLQDIAKNIMVGNDIMEIKENIGGLLSTGFEAAAASKKAGPTGDVSAVRAAIETIYGGLYDNWKAGVLKGVGGAYSSAMDNFLAAGQLIYAYKTLMYHTAITPRMRRHWNTVFTPMVPNASMAYVLYKRGIFTLEQFNTHAAMDGWDENGAAQLLEAMTLLPSPREAFYLWTKGLITQAQRDALYTAGGYAPEWHMALNENWMYTPSIYDMVRMADFLELDQIWVMDILKRRGVRDKDRAKIWEMLQKRPLREEIRDLTTKWTWRMQYGRATQDEMDTALIELGIRAKERELLLEKAAMDYEDELITEWVEILTWRFRTAVITEEAFLEGLITLGIRQEKANLIVEVEKAKGYYGYY